MRKRRFEQLRCRCRPRDVLNTRRVVTDPQMPSQEHQLSSVLSQRISEVPVIRHIVLVKLKEGVQPEQLDEIETALSNWRSPDRRGFTFARDLGLRQDNMTFAVIAEFEDTEAYDRYDTDIEHNRIRAELIGPIAVSSSRLQFEVP